MWTHVRWGVYGLNLCENLLHVYNNSVILGRTALIFLIIITVNITIKQKSNKKIKTTLIYTYVYYIPRHEKLTYSIGLQFAKTKIMNKF